MRKDPDETLFLLWVIFFALLLGLTAGWLIKNSRLGNSSQNLKTTNTNLVVW